LRYSKLGGLLILVLGVGVCGAAAQDVGTVNLQSLREDATSTVGPD
jgi:hypothetical protein